MATYTSGTTSTSFASFVTSANSIMTPFNADGFGGNTSPNGVTYYRIFNVECFIRGESGTVNATFYIGTSAGSNNIASISLGSVGTTFTTKSASANVFITAGTKYFAGHFSSGHRASRTNGGSSGDFAGVFHGSSLAGVTNASTSQTNFVLEYHGVPDQTTGVSASFVSGSTVNISWSAPGGGGAAIRGYVVQHSTNNSSWSTIYDSESTATSFTHTSASQNATNFYRVSAFNNLRASTGTGVSNALGPYSASTSVFVPSPISPPVLSGSFDSGTVGVAYSSQISATNSPTSWSISSGNLPPGLSGSGSSSGYAITGTPTSAGTYNFGLTATNDGGPGSGSYSITIASPPNPSWSSTGAFGSGKVNQGYFEQRTASNTTSISNASTTAPGLSASGSGNTLTLQGTPTLSGTFAVSATANGASGTTPATLSTTVTIAPLVPPTWSDTSLSGDFRVGVSYASTSGGNNSVSATNATSFSLVGSGSLPAGISGSTSGSTYTLVGTPTTRGSYSFTLRATNSDGNATPDQAFSGNVTHPPFWTDETLAAFSQGRSYSDSIAVSTSTPVTWTITAGSLPVGVTSTTSGTNTNTFTLAGTPTGSGAYSFTIQASNGDGTLTKTFSGNILLVPNWTDNILGSFVDNVEYSDSVIATNSPTYSVTAGALPAGITLNSSTGLVSGTPTGGVGASYSFTIRAANTDGNVTQAFSGTIQPDLGGGIKLFDGTAWDNKEIYAYDGTTWVLGRLYVYSGTAWIKSVY